MDIASRGHDEDRREKLVDFVLTGPCIASLPKLLPDPVDKPLQLRVM